jgi:Domain of unknown function (DUF4382)
MRRFILVPTLLLPLASLTVFLVSCSSNSNNSMQMATVQVSLSDPATCSAPQGSFSHIYVTVTDVRIHQSSTASDTDSGWVDLAPGLAASPVQVDLLGAATQCFLKMLGSSEIQPGSYQQIRILLADNSATVSGNQCGSAANCVVLASDPLNPRPLQLSSESKTGIKIPSGQIAGGKFVVAAGESKDLNLDFNACRSIVTEGGGTFRLKPVLHAGEVAPQAAISGTVIDAATQAPIVGGNTVVALEQSDSNGVDRVVMETVTDSSGAFSFCPVASGTYDIVIAAVNGAGVAYAATVITGVQSSAALGQVPLTPALVPASIMGTITTSTGSAATSADLSLSALQSIMVNGSNLLVTVPLAAQSASTATLMTAPGASCPANTDCVSYTLSIPAANPSVGAFSSSGNQSPALPTAGTVSYTLDAAAFVPGSAGQADCSPSEVQTSQTSGSTPLTVTPGASVTAATLAFTGCSVVP